MKHDNFSINFLSIVSMLDWVGHVLKKKVKMLCVWGPRPSSYISGFSMHSKSTPIYRKQCHNSHNRGSSSHHYHLSYERGYIFMIYWCNNAPCVITHRTYSAMSSWSNFHTSIIWPVPDFFDGKKLLPLTSG